jgi:hypothetical protein
MSHAHVHRTRRARERVEGCYIKTDEFSIDSYNSSTGQVVVVVVVVVVAISLTV